MSERRWRPGNGGNSPGKGPRVPEFAPGKRTLVEQGYQRLPAPTTPTQAQEVTSPAPTPADVARDPVQRKATGAVAPDGRSAADIASPDVSGAEAHDSAASATDVVARDGTPSQRRVGHPTAEEPTKAPPPRAVPWLQLKGSLPGAVPMRSPETGNWSERGASVQRKAASEVASDGAPAAEIASRGVASGGGQLPHLGAIQASFGHHEVSGVTAHQGPAAEAASDQLGAKAFATGNAVAFREAPDLHTAAHEAAHVVQQRGGVQLKGGIDGGAGDPYERHADAVADAVVTGRSAAPLLDQVPGGGRQQAAVQRAPAIPATPATGASASGPEVAPPVAGIDKPGFIDNSDGSNIRTGPAEADGKLVRSQPLPPATRVFVSGTHPSAPEWWYVTAFLEGAMVRGYVQHGRVNTELPEPTAKLHQVVGGDTAEQLAVQEYKSAVRDGHDLRYYENVLLYVNKQQNRVGITGSYQDPGVLGGGNNVQLVAGHRIWLVSPAFAKTLEGVVPDGSLTGGAVAKAKRFVAHLEDILKSVTESRHHFGEVAGEYAQAIRDHLAPIVGIVAGFIVAEAGSAFLAATPTGVGQIAAVVIQLALSAFGAAGAVQASAEAVKHASEWLTLAWTAKGDEKQIAAASKEFLKMLVGIAMAALSALGAKANYGNALKIASSMPTGGLPAMAVAGGGQVGGAKAGAGVLIGPGTGSIGTAGNAMMQADDKNGGGRNDRSTKSTDPAKELENNKNTDSPSESHKSPPSTLNLPQLGPIALPRALGGPRRRLSRNTT